MAWKGKLEVHFFLPFYSPNCVFITDHMEFQALYSSTSHLGKIAVVEQVQTIECHTLMADLGVDWVEGWAVGYPQPNDPCYLRRDLE